MDFNEAYDDTNTSVGLAARSGNFALLQQLLRDGHSTNGHDNRGWRPLHEAAANGHTECVRLLLMAEDAEVDALTHEGYTALLLACQQENAEVSQEVVKQLLIGGADSNMLQGDTWCLPLPQAVEMENISVVRQLLDAKASVNRTDFQHGAPIHVAAEKGNVSIIEVLLSRGADILTRDERGFTALHCLMEGEHRNIEALHAFLGNPDCVNAQLDDGCTPLMLALQGGWTEASVTLLDCGALASLALKNGTLPLHFAMQYYEEISHDAGEHSEEEQNSKKLVHRLLESTPRELFVPKPGTTSKVSLYHLAIEWEKYSNIKELVEFGIPADSFLQETGSAIIDEEDVDLFGQVPLVLPVDVTLDTPLAFILSRKLTEKSVDLAKYLIANGSSVNVFRKGCLPPLAATVKHQRVEYGKQDLAGKLLDHILDNGASILYRINPEDILPVSLHVSSLFNVGAFFRLLQRGVDAQSIFTPQVLHRLSQYYEKERFYAVHPMFPWRVISWLNALSHFIPNLPSNTLLMFDQNRMVTDENLQTAWTNLQIEIETPKKLQQLSVLCVRRAVGSSKGWNRFQENLNLLCLSLPPFITQLLHFEEVSLTKLFHFPPKSAMLQYMTQVTDNEEITDNELVTDNEETTDNEEDIDNEDDYMN